MTDAEIRNYFNGIAGEYDKWRYHSRKYRDAQMKLLKTHIPDGKTILEIGCGTGDVLAGLNPVEGVGADISENMIKKAQGKYSDSKNLRFQVVSGKLPFGFVADFVIMVDVVEHLASVRYALCEAREAMYSRSRLIIITGNSRFAWLFDILEWLGLKMPEGKHRWIPNGELKVMLETSGFEIQEEGQIYYGLALYYICRRT